MQAKNERVELRLDQETLHSIDDWAAERGLSRAEAVRQLIDRSLSRFNVPISDGERLTIHMLCDIYKKLDITDSGGFDPRFVESALVKGHTWALNWTYPGIFHGSDSDKNTVSNVVGILDMWDFIETGYGKLTSQEKKRVATEAELYGKTIQFPGFSGNEEAEHLSVALFLIEDMGRFPTFSGRELNSHFPVLERYWKMRSVFEPIRTKLIGGELNASQLISILNASVNI